jgi:hypothetical protein
MERKCLFAVAIAPSLLSSIHTVIIELFRSRFICSVYFPFWLLKSLYLSLILPPFILFSEPPLNFRPTYKLDPNSDEYDTGSKKRIPAWTDRILYMKKKGFTCTAYDSDQSLKTSDHRPVFASFSSAIEISKSEETDEPLGDLTAESDRPHPEFSSETQVCSLM